MDQTKPARSDGTALLEKACDVLEAVGASAGGISQAALAAKLGLPRTTLYRILSALVARGLLRQDPSRRVYGIGFRLLEMTQGAWSAPDLPSAAAPELRALRDATGETAYIAVLEGGEAVALGKFEGAHEVRSAARLGQRKPLHCTSQGKAMLAFLPDDQREALLRKMSYPVLTPYTLRDRRQLVAALQVTRARGFSIDDEEIVEGVRCVGAPVLDAEGRVLGALSVAGPAWRMTRERLELLGPEVAAAGKRIGAAVRPPPGTAGGVTALPAPVAFHGLGPRWSADGRLWWADALAPALFNAGVDGVPSMVARLAAPIAGFVLSRDGGCLVVDQTGGVLRLGVDGAAGFAMKVPALQGLQTLVAHPDGGVWTSMPAGGTGDTGGTGGSRIGRLDDHHVPGPIWELPGVVGALAWTADGDALYAASADTGAIHRLEPGRATPRLVTRIPPGGGRPAALALDDEGGIWTALRDGWSVARLTADGEVDRVLPLPVPRPTGLGFGGPDRTTLYVATARDGVALDVLSSAPLSGRLLALSPGVRGLSEPAARV